VFEFVDLFAGVGGFHAALGALGGSAVQAAEIDDRAAGVYELNWGLRPDRDVRWLAEHPDERVKDHAVLTGGFPCQPFSKSGRQLGITEERGTLFHDIIRILDAKQPPVVMLENVRNLAGVRQRDAWSAILAGLRRSGYKTSNVPCVFSPHLLGPEHGGAPQWRERVYILGVKVGRARAEAETTDTAVVENAPHGDWNPSNWTISTHLLRPELMGEDRQAVALTNEESHWIDTWNELLARLGSDARLPGFPLWEPDWRMRRRTLAGLPSWKQVFIRRNHDFYLANRPAIDAWRRQHPEIRSWPLSRRKLEWQAQDGERDIWQHLVQFRPSGIRVKRATWAPALVAMSQTSIYGPQRRRLTVMETAALQGFDPDSFTFGDQPDADSYKQMGNAVNVGVVQHVLRSFVDRYADDIAATGVPGEGVVRAILGGNGERTDAA
jgi:DNA (cytosine-5)-methyltransferase 1